ncbi:MAG: transaldolase family protein [Christensenellales bacterium]|jgi:fructose-6-phosphate aldolase 2
MLYFADSCNAQDVARLLEKFPIDGVTTNPTIVAREKGDLGDLLADIREAIGPEMPLFVQTMQEKWQDMVREAYAIHDYVGGAFIVKLPATPDGLRATRELKERGMQAALTAVFSPQQALLAAKCGADYVALYINKLEDTATDGASVLARMKNLLHADYPATKLLAASFRNAEQVVRVCECGADAVTLPVPFYEKLMWHPLTDAALAKFRENWSDAYGDDTPLDLLPR